MSLTSKLQPWADFGCKKHLLEELLATEKIRSDTCCGANLPSCLDSWRSYCADERQLRFCRDLMPKGPQIRRPLWGSKACESLSVSMVEGAWGQRYGDLASSTLFLYFRDGLA